MQWLLLIKGLLLIGLCQAGRLDEDQTNLHILRRIVREASDVSFKEIFGRGLEAIIHNCKESGYSDKEEELRKLYNERNNCLKEKVTHEISREEYVDRLNECVKEFADLSKSCLPDDKKYYPDFLDEISKSTHLLAFDVNGNLTTCLFRVVRQEDARRSLYNCLTTAEEKVHDLLEIDTSQVVFCEKLQEGAVCYPNAIAEFCEDNEFNREFKVLFHSAITAPCNSVLLKGSEN